MNNIDKTYQALLQDILDNGVEKTDRTGTGTISVFGRQIRHKMSEGYPLLTTKKMAFKTMVTELLWFLRGDTNIKYLVDNDCHIWDGDAYKNYEKWFWDNIPPKADTSGKLTQEEFINKIKTDDEFAKKWGELGPIYGKQWRRWEILKRDNTACWKKTIDQIQNLINDLKTNPDSRRLMVNAWNVGEMDQMVLPPCHYSWQVYTRELSIIERGEIYRKKHPEKTIEDFPPGKMDVHKVRDIFNEDNIPTRAISLMWNQRSCDVGLGIPFNIASYGLLLLMLANEVNMIPDELIGNLGDCHIYKNHIEGVKEQLTRKPMTLPTVEIIELDLLKGSVDLELKNYIHHPAIKLPLSN
jgi:thymidylate synthase